ncbi:hypothetical protein GCM10009838_79300 [Catenulispora subtropica]|uniref:Uncharacterized protein n=1 Tax=Catenulispora subtropica TaxID=450798 RepID=A0ABN2T989_9ACTN
MGNPATTAAIPAPPITSASVTEPDEADCTVRSDRGASAESEGGRGDWADVSTMDEPGVPGISLLAVTLGVTAVDELVIDALDDPAVLAEADPDVFEPDGDAPGPVAVAALRGFVVVAAVVASAVVAAVVAAAVVGASDVVSATNPRVTCAPLPTAARLYAACPRQSPPYSSLATDDPVSPPASVEVGAPKVTPMKGIPAQFEIPR